MEYLATCLRQRLQDYPPIAGPKRYCSVVGNGARTTIAFGLQAPSSDTARYEVAVYCFGTPLRELAIKGRITLIVRMPLHLQTQARLLTQGGHQRIQASPGRGQQVGLALREIQVRPNQRLAMH